MKLVFALVVIINTLPKNTDGMYFETAESCNQIAFQTEKGIAGENQQWTTPVANIKAYCEPRLVDKSAQTFDKKTR